jgi:uncharacterized protein (DUF885 family)
MQKLIILLLLITTGRTSQAQLHKLFDRYHEASMHLFPIFATYSGDHRFDDQLEIDGMDNIATRKKTFLSFQKELQSIDRSTLSIPDRISYDVLAPASHRF